MFGEPVERARGTSVPLGNDDPTAVHQQWRFVLADEFAPASAPIHSFRGAQYPFDMLIVTPE